MITFLYIPQFPIMNNRKFTFWSLLQQRSIVIPQIQRDFAYGRQTEKAIKVRNELLDAIWSALVKPDTDFKQNQSIVLDFVYGSLSKDESMTPLDGQQRLTTLYLLHLYATIKEQIERSELLKFRYETRHTANEFCKSLIKDFYYDLSSTKTLKSQIMNQAKYLNSYDDDPTIQSMLVVLDVIHNKFHSVDNLWNKLTQQERVYFYYLDLEKFGLSDDLYIKMNSRGKSLTKFEIFKSALESYVETIVPSRKDEMSTKLDGLWTNMLWLEGASVDSGFLNLFNNIFKLNYYCKQSNPIEILTTEKCYKEMLSNVSDLDSLVNIMDSFANLMGSNPKGISNYYDKFFYVSDQALGQESKIRFFWPSKDNLFYRATAQSLTWAELLVFYAIILSLRIPIDENVLFLRFRQLRNLVVNSLYELRPENIHNMLTATRKLIEEGTLPQDTFGQNQIEEELKKIEFKDVENRLLKFENHEILRGAIGLFMIESKTIDAVVDSLHNFCSIFNNDYKSNTPLLRQSMLSIGDYSQVDTDIKKRFLVNKPDAWRSFFTINQRRKDQEHIVRIVNSIKVGNSLTDDLKLLIENRKISGKKDWAYYFINYDIDLHGPNTQGYYFWEDRANKPLEIIWLNSSSESPYNLEWNIFNWVLYTKNKEVANLDDHGASSLILFNVGISMNGVQNGYKIESLTENNPIFEELLSKQVITSEGMHELNEEDDFIERGHEFIQLVTLLKKSSGDLKGSI